MLEWAYVAVHSRFVLWAGELQVSTASDRWWEGAPGGLLFTHAESGQWLRKGGNLRRRDWRRCPLLVWEAFCTTLPNWEFSRHKGWQLQLLMVMFLLLEEKKTSKSLPVKFRLIRVGFFREENHSLCSSTDEWISCCGLRAKYSFSEITAQGGSLMIADAVSLVSVTWLRRTHLSDPTATTTTVTSLAWGGMCEWKGSSMADLETRQG